MIVCFFESPSSLRISFFRASSVQCKEGVCNFLFSYPKGMPYDCTTPVRSTKGLIILPPDI